MRNLFDLVDMKTAKQELERLRQAELDLPFDATQDQLDSIKFQEKYWHTLVTAKFHVDKFVKTIDAQATRIADLEADRDHWRNLVDDLEHNDVYLDSKAYYEGRIAELEAAIALSR